MKIKRTTPKTKPRKLLKQTRARIDSRIAASATPSEKRNLAMYKQSHAPTRIQCLVQEFALVRHLRDNPKARASADATMAETWRMNNMTGEFAPDPSADRLLRAQKNGMEFIRDAMLSGDAEAIIALGMEMKRLAADFKPSFDLDQRRRELLACGVTTGKAAAAIIDQVLRGKTPKDNQLENESRQLKRIKSRWRKG